MKNIIIIGMLYLSMTYAISTSTEVVVDNKTKLEWQNELINKTETRSWQSAITYCENLNLDDKIDWRLPNINELKSLIDYETTFNPVTVSTLRGNTLFGNYWSSTTSANDTQYSFIIHFGSGTGNSSKKENLYYFRCVRDY